MLRTSQTAWCSQTGRPPARRLPMYLHRHLRNVTSAQQHAVQAFFSRCLWAAVGPQADKEQPLTCAPLRIAAGQHTSGLAL